MDYDRQNPAFYALLVALIFMAVGPIVLMFSNSFKLDVDIIGGTSGLIFYRRSRIMKPRCATSYGTSPST